jgi:hypothetical protein
VVGHEHRVWAWVLVQLETVAVETPAARATSTIVVMVARCYSRRLGAPP